ncbi:MAG TPA: peptidoglycan editing factor PgeF [Tissierellaceae bacterium]|nr:peptidoglycan editing factor PgeF [Tissierellaceae bacterium]
MEYKIVKKDNIRYIVIPELESLGLKHCFTTADINMSFFYNSLPEEIISNHKKVLDFMNIQPKEIFSSIQKHTNNVAVIDNINLGKEYEIGKVVENNDGFVTDLDDIALISKYADCTPIILYDPVKKVHSNIHSGWKGTLQKIGAVGVKSMIENYGSNPKDIIAVLGPNIDKNDFEVDKDVKNLFKNEFEFHEEIISKKNNIKFLIDLHKTNKRILMKEGIKEEKISIIDISTMSNPMLHSFRRDKNEFGLMAVVTSL